MSMSVGMSFAARAYIMEVEEENEALMLDNAALSAEVEDLHDELREMTRLCLYFERVATVRQLQLAILGHVDTSPDVEPGVHEGGKIEAKEAGSD